MYICDVCKSNFTTKSNLKTHQERAKYCKKIQNKTYLCKFCNLNINLDELTNHNYKCLEFQYELIRIQNEELKQRNKDLEDQIKDITIKLIDTPNRIL